MRPQFSSFPFQADADLQHLKTLAKAPSGAAEVLDSASGRHEFVLPHLHIALNAEGWPAAVDAGALQQLLASFTPEFKGFKGQALRADLAAREETATPAAADEGPAGIGAASLAVSPGPLAGLGWAGPTAAAVFDAPIPADRPLAAFIAPAAIEAGPAPAAARGAPQAPEPGPANAAETAPAMTLAAPGLDRALAPAGEAAPAPAEEQPAEASPPPVEAPAPAPTPTPAPAPAPAVEPPQAVEPPAPEVPLPDVSPTPLAQEPPAEPEPPVIETPVIETPVEEPPTLETPVVEPPIAEPPAPIAPSAVAVALAPLLEGSAGALIGAISVVDADGAAFDASYQVSVSDPRFIAVFEDGAWRLKLAPGEALDFEAGPVAVRVTVTDPQGLSAFSDMAVNGADAGEHVVLSDAGEVFFETEVDELSVTGGAGDDSLTGAGGDDVLYGGGGADALIGGDGADSLYADDAAAATSPLIALDGSQPGAGVSASGAGNETILFETPVQAATLVLSGGEYFQHVRVTAYRGGVAVGTANGEVYGQDAAVSIDLGEGVTFDELRIEAASDDPWGYQVEYTAIGATDYAVSGVYVIETPAAVGDTLEGGAGNDQLFGGAGADEILGGAGDDVLIGALGGDLLDGGEGFDTADYSQAGHGLTLALDAFDWPGFNWGALTAENLGAALGDTLVSIESIIGTQFDDNIYGTADGLSVTLGAGDDYYDTRADQTGIDIIDGGAGQDRIFTGGGDDQIQGGDGRDAIKGEDGDDTIDGGAGSDWLHGDAGNDVISGGEGSDNIYGGAGNDMITAGDGYDSIDGGAGDDVISSGADNDYWVHGGDGSDMLLWALGDGADRFFGGAGASWTDVISLSGAGGSLEYGADWTVSLSGGAGFTLDPDGGALLLSQDADGVITISATGEQIHFQDIEQIRWDG